MSKKAYFPLFVDLSDKKILVVGGGNVATRRVKTLLPFTKQIMVIAPKMTEELYRMVKMGTVSGDFREVKKTDFEDVYMVLACTNDEQVNNNIYYICKDMGIYVNLANSKEKCDFFFPGVVKKDEAVVGITA
ncbi:MAG: bifunctional precorrin-2 dehydrogenase/sirohydrochlorin ferrochelatase, partial [Clostridiales bacterium]|nr:bifunctional precorrin-2 dehydrogenase/sirohydrochlorin ferrochelatase [Candidatus Blautia equi]